MLMHGHVCRNILEWWRRRWRW